jgi:hypothetical protein
MIRRHGIEPSVTDFAKFLPRERLAEFERERREHGESKPYVIKERTKPYVIKERKAAQSEPARPKEIDQ